MEVESLGNHRSRPVRPGTGYLPGAVVEEGLQRSDHLLIENPVRMLWCLVRLEGLAQHR